VRGGSWLFDDPSVVRSAFRRLQLTVFPRLARLSDSVGAPRHGGDGKRHGA
jgi:hypothetical protein